MQWHLKAREYFHPFLSESIHSNELCNSVLSKILNSENKLPLRQWANNIAARSPQVQLTPIVLNDW